MKPVNKIFVLLLPFLLLKGMECFFPLDSFTFRCWEALIALEPQNFSGGTFYPWQHLQKTEVGDLGHNTPLAISKKVEWFTDQYGYRNRPWQGPVDIILLGDSFMTGASLTQDDTLAHVLSVQMNLNVVSIAPCNLTHFLSLKEFAVQPPKWIVYSIVERNLSELQLLPQIGVPQMIPNTNDWLLTQKIFWDRLFRNNFVSYTTASLTNCFDEFIYAWQPKTTQSVGHGYYDDIYLPRGFRYPLDPSIIFFSGIRANHPVSIEIVQSVAKIIQSYQHIIEGRGSQFLFMPIPNKESIYWNLLEPPIKNSYLEDLAKECQYLNINMVELKKPFLENSVDNLLYQKDDTHWSPHGAKMAADEISRLLKRISEKKSD